MQHEILTYEADGLTMKSELFFEPASEPRAGVLVFPEAFGMSEHAISKAQRLASLGYVALAADLHSDIDAFVRIARSVAQEPDRVRRMTTLLFDHLSARLETHGFAGDTARRHEVLDGDIGLNAAGLDLWLTRRGA